MTLLLLAGLLWSNSDDTKLPDGTLEQQVAAIRKQLDTARTEYIAKLEKAKTTAERDQLMKEVPRPQAYAEKVLRVVAAHPTDAAALDALLWVVGNTPPGGSDSPNTKAKAIIAKDFAKSDRLAPLAVALTWSANSGDEDILRQLQKVNPSDAVQAALKYALALQLIAQADMIELHHLRLETATDDMAMRRIKESLDTDFGRDTAERLRAGQAKTLRAEAEKLLDELVSDRKFSEADWPAKPKTIRIKELAKRERLVLQTLVVGKKAPATAGTDLAGEKLTLADYRGKTVLLTFTGHWCAACRTLYPQERELVKSMDGRPFTIVSINSDDSRDAVKKVLEDEKLPWPTIWDGGSTEGPLATMWNVSAWPLVVLIDHDGVIRYKFPGAPEPAILTPLVTKLVAEAEARGKK
jgi:peroxiredoxin